MRKVKQLISFFMFVVVMFSSQLMYSQTTAAINGSVVDQNGNPLPGANIIAIHIPSNTQFGTTSRVDGLYNLVNLKVGGPYKVTVSFIGYASQIEEGFNLELGQNLKINFTLTEQAVQLTGVTVTAERGAILSQARTGATQNVSLKQIEELPSISRSFASFAKLSPLFSGSGTGLGAAGRSSKFNNIQIDGAQYNDLFGLGSSGTPGGSAGANPISLDAIREFQVVIAPFDVKQSGFTGGGINAITRSGTNQFSGSLFFYGRNESLVGQRDARTGLDTKYPKFQDYQYGFRLGGPIIKDQLFFFINGEMTVYNRPVENISLLSTNAGVYQPLIDRFRTLLIAKGITNPGTEGTFTSERPSSKLLLKFDYNLAENHQLSLRHNFVDAYQDNLFGRSSTGMSFDSYNYRFNSQVHSSVLQLNSRFGNNISNELILGYTRIREFRSNTGIKSPQINVKEINQTYTMIAGFDQYSGANQLDQDIFEITDNFYYYAGNHTFTIGTHNEFFSFRNLYIRNFFGYYEYNSLDDFQNDLPYNYYRTYSRQGDPIKSLPAAQFDVAQFGFYVQDEWAVLPELKLTIGARVDIPTYPTLPAANDSVAKYFKGYKTNSAPTGNLLFSPRVGFNWDVSGDRTTQVRGGIGIFTGRVPYVWMSNNFGNSGMLMAEITNVRGKKIAFQSDPARQYYFGDPRIGQYPTGTEAGAFGTSASVKSEINMADPALKMPQLLRFSIGLDQQLPFGFIGTVDLLLSKAVNDMLYRKLNLKPAVTTTGAYNYIRTPNGSVENSTGRPLYGGTDAKNNNFNDVLEIYNTSDNYQYNLSFQIQRNVSRGFSVNTGYAYGRAFDRNSTNSSQAQSQMRYLPIDNDPNSPALTTSDWEIRHRLFASISFTEEFFENAPTTITLFYNGQSGQPFSFIAGGDLNNDGLNSNDLFYIPSNCSQTGDILLVEKNNAATTGIIYQTGSGSSLAKYVLASAQNYSDLNGFIENNEYLKSHRGQIS